MTLQQSLNGGRNDTPNAVSVRQTVLSAPINTAGLPTFLPTSTGAGVLTLTTQNITADAPMVATAAIGVDGHGEANAVGILDTQISWTCTNAATNYLPILISNGGIIAQPITLLPPIYQWGGTPATTNTQYTYNIQEGKMYLGDGTSANQVPHVIVGEAVAAGGNITSTVAYALQGRYDSGYTATLPAASTTTSKNHNLGTDACKSFVVIECTTSEGGIAIGSDTNLPLTIVSGGSPSPVTPLLNKLAVSFSVATGGWAIISLTTFIYITLTPANWKYKVIVERSF